MHTKRTNLLQFAPHANGRLHDGAIRMRHNGVASLHKVLVRLQMEGGAPHEALAVRLEALEVGHRLEVVALLDGQVVHGDLQPAVGDARIVLGRLQQECVPLLLLGEQGVGVGGFGGGGWSFGR